MDESLLRFCEVAAKFSNVFYFSGIFCVFDAKFKLLVSELCRSQVIKLQRIYKLHYFGLWKRGVPSPEEDVHHVSQCLVFPVHALYFNVNCVRVENASKRRSTI